MKPEMDIAITRFDGDRRQLMGLFELADDSPQSVNGYLERGTVLAAEMNGRIVGMTLIDLDAATADIVSLAVEPESQGHGVGRALVEAARSLAAQAGARRIEVATAAADIGNLRFYQRAGFRFARIERDAFTPDAGYPEAIEIDGITLRDRIVFDLDF